MDAEDYKKYSHMLVALSELRCYPNGKNLDLVESKFLNIYGKAMAGMRNLFMDFYRADEEKRRDLIVKIAKIDGFLDKLEEGDGDD